LYQAEDGSGKAGATRQPPFRRESSSILPVYFRLPSCVQNISAFALLTGRSSEYLVARVFDIDIHIGRARIDHRIPLEDRHLIVLSSAWQAMFEEAMLCGEKRKRATEFSSLTRGKRQRDISADLKGHVSKRFL